MIYVYTRVYAAARKQVLALRSGYKRHYRVKSAKSFIPEFRLRQSSTTKGPTVEKAVELTENNVDEKSVMLTENNRPPPDSITLRIHHGRYQNPIIEAVSRNNETGNKPVDKIRRQRVPANTFWRKFSKDQRAAKFIGIIMGVFVVCWLPFFLYLTLSGVFVVRLKNDENHELLFKIFAWLGYTNSALDVLVYVSTSKELQATFFKLFIPRRCRRANIIN